MDSPLKIAIEEKIRNHERAFQCLRYHDQEKVEIRIAVYKEILKMIDRSTPTDIDDNTPDCNCKQHKVWHKCPRHGWCNPVTGVGV